MKNTKINIDNSQNKSLVDQNIIIEQFQPLTGEGSCQFDDQHTIFMSVSPRPVRLLHVQAGQNYLGMYQKGDMCLTPANVKLFARWESDDNYLRIRLDRQYLAKVARESLEINDDRLEILPQFHFNHQKIESIAMMLWDEIQGDQTDTNNNNLYLDSLTNVLAINLLRDYINTKPTLPSYEGGLAPRQLNQVLAYVDSYLDSNIKLADLSELLNMSQFHFSRLFKQSLDISPHQYVTKQRVEKAKKLLNKNDRLITDIALECGFNSH